MNIRDWKSTENLQWIWWLAYTWVTLKILQDYFKLWELSQLCFGGTDDNEKKSLKFVGHFSSYSSLSLSLSLSLYIYIYIYIIYSGSLVKWIECSPMIRETRDQSQVASYQRFKKILLDTSLLNTQQYKLHIKGKEEQSRKRCSALPYTSV